MYAFKGSSKSRRKCALSRWLSLCLQPRTLLLLAALLLTSTAILLLCWTGYTSPVIIAEHSYGIVVDAGSSSSKVHLFQWPLHDGNPTKLLTIKPVVDEFGDPRIKKVEPGIATFSNSPETAFTSIQPLLEFSLSHIPASQHSHTVLYIFGTAGMRLLPKEEQRRIVEVLYERVSQEFPFHLPKDGVQVISGKMEGVFSWITINYLLGRLSPEYQHPPSKMTTPALESSGNERPPHVINTVGSLDMGGASLQVTFEIPHYVEVPPDSTVDINLGCLDSVSDSQHKHRVFVSTYLGYGSNEARARYLRGLLLEHLEKSTIAPPSDNQSSMEASVHLHSLRDPCSPLDYVENITIDGHSFKIRGLGDFRGCKRALLPLLKNPGGGGGKERGSGSQLTHTPCTDANCSLGLIPNFQRPPVSLKYESLDFYGTSEFWYTMRDVLRIGGHYTTYSFEKASTEYCHTNWKVLMDRFLRRLYMYADHYRLKSQCMKSAWLSLVLHEGLGFPKNTISLHSVASMEGQSVQWALGALLYNTRYIPIREVQLHHQLQAPPLSEWHVTYPSSLRSSFLLPFLMVLGVAILLLCCRQRRPYRSFRDQQGQLPHHSMHRSQSLNSLVKIHRRMSSVAMSALQVVGLDTPNASPAPEYSRSNLGLTPDCGRGGVGGGSKLKFMV